MFIRDAHHSQCYSNVNVEKFSQRTWKEASQRLEVSSSSLYSYCVKHHYQICIHIKYIN